MRSEHQIDIKRGAAPGGAGKGLDKAGGWGGEVQHSSGWMLLLRGYRLFSVG